MNKKLRKFVIDRIVSNLNKRIRGEGFDSGATNIFIKVSDGIGLKFCASEKVRNNNYFRQSQAAQFELGPEVYGKINFWFGDTQYFGYLTEIVEVYANTNDEDKFKSIATSFEREKVVVALKESINFTFTDSHIWNFGIKNGKLVCIDFDNFDELGLYDRVSVEDMKDSIKEMVLE